MTYLFFLRFKSILFIAGLFWSLFATVPLASAQPLQILIQPVSQTNSIGSTATFTVSASSTNGPLAYRWLLNGIAIPLATNASLTLTNVQASDSGIYAVVVSDNKVVMVSQPARLLVLVKVSQGQDFFTNATVLPTVDTNNRAITEDLVRGDNFGAGKEPGEPNHGGKKGGASVWYKWTAPIGGGTVTFSTAGSDFDTLLGAYQGTSVGNLTSVVSSDYDSDDDGGYLASKVVFNANGGQDYFIAVDGFGRSTGNLVLEWKLRPVELLPTLTTRPHSRVFGTNDSAFVLVGYQNQATVAEGRWYFNELDTGNTSNLFGSFPMDASHVGTYYVSVKTTSGRTIRVADAVFQINTTLSNGLAFADTNQFTLDKFFDAIDKSTNGLTLNSTGSSSPGLSLQSYDRAPEGGPASGYTSTQIFSTSSSTHEPGEPNHCGLVGGSSEWFSYQPSTNGYASPVLRINTDGSGFPTILAVYTNTAPGNSFTNLVPIACDSGHATNGLGSGVIFPAVNGAVYFIVVDGVNGANGTAKLNINLGDPVSLSGPTNQIVFAGSNATFSTSVTGGTGPVTYQWQSSGTNIANATNGTYTVTNAQPASAGTYSVIVGNLVGPVTNSATLSLFSSPVILSQPVSHSVSPSNSVSLNIVASGAPGPFYQWQFNGLNLDGATNSILTVTNFQKTNEGTYRVVVTNTLGAVTSSNAVLLANAPLRFYSFGANVGNGFQWQLVGFAGTNYIFQASTNLVDWIPLLTNNDPNGFLFFTDPNASNFLRRFYRAQPGP